MANKEKIELSTAEKLIVFKALGFYAQSIAKIAKAAKKVEAEKTADTATITVTEVDELRNKFL